MALQDALLKARQRIGVQSAFYCLFFKNEINQLMECDRVTAVAVGLNQRGRETLLVMLRGGEIAYRNPDGLGWGERDMYLR